MTAPTLSERLLVLIGDLEAMGWTDDAATCREAALELARLESQLAGLAKPAQGFIGER